MVIRPISVDASYRSPAKVLRRALWLVIVSSCFIRAAGNCAEFWYEDNNLGFGGGLPTDFFGRYDAPETWTQASQAMDVFCLRSNSFRFFIQGRSTFQQKMATVHNSNGTRFAIDSTEAGWAHYLSDFTTPTFGLTIGQIEDLQSNGVTVTDITLQSVLSKPTPDGEPYAMSWRIKDVVEFFKQVKPLFPAVRIGIIDALPTHNRNYKGPYSDLKTALAEEGYALDFIHLDMPFSYPRNRRNGNSWSKMVAVGEYIQNVIGAELGLICTDNVGGSASNNLYRQYVLDGVKKYIQAGGKADQYILMAWFPYPNETVPDDMTAIPPGDATQLRIFREMVSVVTALLLPTGIDFWDYDQNIPRVFFPNTPVRVENTGLP